MTKATMTTEQAAAYKDAIQSNQDVWEMLRDCNQKLETLKTIEFRFVAYIIYSVEFQCYIAGIEMYSNSVKNTSMVILAQKDHFHIGALKTVHAKIIEWHEMKSIPLDEAPFFI